MRVPRSPRFLIAPALLAAAALAAVPLASATPATAQPAASGEPSAAAEAPWLTGYWHNFDNGSAVLPLSEVPSQYNMVAVAFADNQEGVPGGIDFTVATDELGGYTEQEFKDDVAALQAEGRSVVLSIGGELGHVDVTNPEEAANFASSAQDVIEEFGFDGIDVDLEHGINAQYMEQALSDLDAAVGGGLVVTMAPQTIDMQSADTEYAKLATGLGDLLAVVNMQYYNSGSMQGCDGQVYEQGTVDFLTALACIQVEDLGLDPGQVGLGLPATSQAAGGGYQDPANVVAALDCLETGENCGSFQPSEPYGAMAGAMTWSVNWDSTSSYAFAETVGARLGTGG
ncbi:chitinase [Nocardiopsis coralliicola]